jgi:copper transport protein
VLGLLVAVAACWGTLLATVPVSGGAPVLVAASPADGEIVKSPDELRLTFDRPVPAGLATVRMTAPSGLLIADGRPHTAPDDTRVLTVPMPQTRYAGTYSVAWSLPSHTLEPISGELGFHVFAPNTPVAVPQISNDRAPVVVAVHTGFRLAATAALTLGVGMAFVLVVVWPAGVGHAPARRLITYSWWSLLVATLGTAVSFGGYAARIPLGEAFDPAVVSAAFGSDVGAGLLARLVVLVPITIALVQLVTGAPADAAVTRWLRGAAVLGCAGALAATWCFARPEGPDGGRTPLAVGAEVALLLAVAVCVGGPVLLWVLLRTGGDSVLRAAVPRLARLMPVCGGLLLAIAPITAGGWQMVALLVLGALVVGTGAAGHWWVRRRTHTRRRDLPGRRARTPLLHAR